VGSKIDCTTKDIKQTAIHWFADLPAVTCIELLRILVPKLGCRSESQIPEIECNARSDPGNLFEFIENLCLLLRIHCVARLCLESSEFFVSETADDVVVDHSRGLHERIANSRADKVEPTLP
jgi:hypothetical protein